MPTSKASERVKPGMSDAELIAVIEDAAAGGAWRAGAWLLEWRKARAVEAAEAARPKPAAVEDVDPFAKVIDIRRR